MIPRLTASKHPYVHEAEWPQNPSRTNSGCDLSLFTGRPALRKLRVLAEH